MKQLRPVLLLTSTLMLSSCASVFDEDDALATTPYHIEHTGRVVIDVHINEAGPFHLALDTAASISALFADTRAELGIDYLPNQWAIIHGAVSSQQFPLIRVDRVRVGEEIWHEARFVAMPGETAASETIDGILGVDFLRRYGVGFVTRKRTVQLYAPALVDHRSLRGWASVPLVPQPIGRSGAALYFFDVEIDGRQIPALFDLGAGLNVINRPAAEILQLTRAELRDENRVFSDTQSDAAVVARYTANEVSIAGIRCRDEPFSVINAGLFESMLGDGSPGVILGAGLFTNRNFLIDFARHRILIKASAADSIVTGQARRR